MTALSRLAHPARLLAPMLNRLPKRVMSPLQRVGSSYASVSTQFPHLCAGVTATGVITSADLTCQSVFQRDQENGIDCASTGLELTASGSHPLLLVRARATCTLAYPTVVGSDHPPPQGRARLASAFSLRGTTACRGNTCTCCTIASSATARR